MTIGTTNSFAKQLRRDQTEVEELLWRHLRNRQLGGLKFRRQATVGKAIPDFICVEKRLIVELDGGQHSEEADAARTAKLTRLGCKVIRFWNHEVIENLDGVLERILAEADALPSRFKNRQPSSNSGWTAKPSSLRILLPSTGEGLVATKAAIRCNTQLPPSILPSPGLE